MINELHTIRTVEQSIMDLVLVVICNSLRFPGLLVYFPEVLSATRATTKH
jgi:hypothetical protein